jgi:choline-sulfatase
MKVHMTRARVAVVALVVLSILGLFLAVRWLRPSPSPSDIVGSLWAERGVTKPNVLLITLDTTRADHLGCYGDSRATTPNVDALARGGVLFMQNASPAPLTLPAHSSIMTGMYPTHHGVRVNGNTALSPSEETLAEIFAERGYATAAFIAAFVLDGRWGLNQGFDVYDDHFDLKKYDHLDLAGVQRPANEVVDAALPWLESHESGPFFAWIHLYDPHTPYEPPEPFASAHRAQGLIGLYDGEIAFADSQVGRLVSWLRESGLDHRTIVIVLGDHGEGLGSHGEANHGYFVYDYALHVPFVVATPFEQLQGVRVSAQTSSVDVFLTLLDLAGIEPPAAAVHGRSLLGAMLHPREAEDADAYSESMTPSVQFGWSSLLSLRTSRYKLIKAPRPELYDLSADPAEQLNVFAREPAVARDLMHRLDGLVAETSADAPEPEAADLDKETLARLAALGYVGGPTTPKAPAASGPLADPKDKLEVFAAVQQAGELIAHDKHDDASRLLEEALREDPRMPQARLMLAGSYSELGRTDEARAQFDLVLEEDPSSVQALVGVAGLLRREGKTDDVIALCRQTLSLDERNVQAYTLLGEVYAGRKDPGKALPYFEKAVEIQPKLTRNRLNLASALVELGQYARAEKILDGILQESPRFPMAQYTRALLYEGQGRISEARAAYEAELEAYPRQYKARFNLGKILYALGDREEAKKQMREVIQIAPKQPEGYLLLARGLLLDEAPVDEIQPLVEKGLSLARTPDIQALGWLLMADVFNRRNQPEKVSEALRKADAYVPGSRRGSSHATRQP